MDPDITTKDANRIGVQVQLLLEESVFVQHQEQSLVVLGSQV